MESASHKEAEKEAFEGLGQDPDLAHSETMGNGALGRHACAKSPDLSEAERRQEESKRSQNVLISL